MTPITTVDWTSSLLVALTTAAVRVLALGAVAALGMAAFRMKTTSVRLFTWTAVLYAALAMPLLERLSPPLLVPTPVFLQFGAKSGEIESKGSQPAAHTPIDVDSVSPRQTAFAEVSPAASTGLEWPTIRWDVVAGAIYVGVFLLLLSRVCVGLVLGRRLCRGAEMICESRITSRLASRARAGGLSFVPQAAESEFISVPFTMGVLRPVVLLPVTWRDWDDAELDGVIAHEVSHVVRRDTLTQRLSLLHCTIFWFSPFAWWLNRHLADLAEQASDEAALASGADCTVYARTLLSFFETLEGGPGRVWWQGVSMANAGRAEQRVERILAWKGTVAMKLKKSIAVVIVALAIPVVYLTASAHPSDRKMDSPRSKGVEVAQDQTPPAPPASHGARVPGKPSNHTHYSYNDDDEQRFVIVTGGSDSLTMSGTRHDAERIKELKKTIPGDFIWLERDGKSYVIRDQATVDRAKGFWAPQEELGRRQEDLGKQQEALGKQQEELGERMEQVHVKVPDMTEDLEKLQAKLKQLNSGGATVEQVGEIQSEIGELQSKIGDLQSQAGEEQSKLGDEMGVLGEKQGELGEQQGELGRQQGELAEQASRQMRQLLDEAIAKGIAQPEK